MKHRSIMSAGKYFMLWEVKLLRSTKNGLCSIPAIKNRAGILRTFHGEVGHRNKEATNKFILDRYWWPQLHRDILEYVKSCERCQKTKPLIPYRTTLNIPLAIIFETFSIDFAGLFPKNGSESKYLLIAVEYLTGWTIVAATGDSLAEVVIRFMEEEAISLVSPRKLLYPIAQDALPLPSSLKS